jgi:glycosyltransferase involved in cell wall biosynthesis
MNISFISNIITPHQIPLCDELCALPNVSLRFIESQDIDKDDLPIGWKATCKKDYVITYDELTSNKKKVIQQIIDSEVVIFGSGDYELIRKRLKLNRLTFIYSERIYKNWKQYAKFPYHWFKFRRLYGHSDMLYLLCASAFAASDYGKLGLFRHKVFKWGYFTHVDESFEVEASHLDASTSRSTPLMWCARFLKWKHPELPIQMAALLKKKGYKFTLDMYGDGEELENSIKLAQHLHADDVINFKGSRPNAEIIEAMRKHDIFLFTSDRNEGWGAVANEAMSNGCVIVGSSSIGSIPFLIKDGYNGCIFKSRSLQSLTEKTEWLINHKENLKKLSINGYRTILSTWSPHQAAQRFRLFAENLLHGKETPFTEGPCSIAEYINNNWFKSKNRQ